MTTPEEWADAIMQSYPDNHELLRTMIADAIRAAVEEATKPPRGILSPEMFARAIVAEQDWWQPGPEFLIDFDKLRGHISRGIRFAYGYYRKA